MATLATSGNPRPPGAQMANIDAANTIPGRGLAHLVSKFETLDKGNKPSFPHQVVGLTASKTMSSLSSLQDNRLQFEKGYAKKDGRVNPSTAPSPVAAAAAAAAALGRTSISSTRSEVAQPNKTNPKDRVSAKVAEKRKLFEADETSSPEKQGISIIRSPCRCILTMGVQGSHLSNANAFKTATAAFSQTEKPDKRLPLSQSCGHIYVAPKTGVYPYPEQEAELTNSEYSPKQSYKIEPQCLCPAAFCSAQS